MTAAAAIAYQPQPMPVLARADEITVRTRFGVVTVPSDALIEMAQGPLGFAQHRKFAVTALPNPKLSQFHLLQSLADPEVSFVISEMPAQGLIAAEDLEEAYAAAGTSKADALVMLIVTVRPTDQGVAVSVNLRAPIVLDVNRRAARQVVLSNPIYSVRHPIEL